MPDPVMKAASKPHASTSLALKPSKIPGISKMDGALMSFRSRSPGLDAGAASVAVIFVLPRISIARGWSD